MRLVNARFGVLFKQRGVRLLASARTSRGALVLFIKDGFFYSDMNLQAKTAWAFIYKSPEAGKFCTDFSILLYIEGANCERSCFMSPR